MNPCEFTPKPYPDDVTSVTVTFDWDQCMRLKTEFMCIFYTHNPMKYHSKHIVSTRTDPNLDNCGGIIMENRTLWVANRGGLSDTRANVTHYDLKGHPLSDPIFYAFSSGTISSQQIVTLSDLFWLQKNVVVGSTGVIVTIPFFSPTAPAIGTASNQPTEQELALERFYNPPNGYFGGIVPPVNITELIQFCILHPERLVAPVFNTFLQQAHSIQLELSLDYTNLSLKRDYALTLMEAQNNIPVVLTSEPVILVYEPTTSLVIPSIKPSAKCSPVSSLTMDGTSLALNQTEGFILELTLSSSPEPQRARTHLLATKSDSFIYGYAPLIDSTQLYAITFPSTGVTKNALYTSLVIATLYGRPFLYATDMANRCIDVFDYNFMYQYDLSMRFLVVSVPNHYTPVNLISIERYLYVVYNQMLIDPVQGQPLILNQIVPGPGTGMVLQFHRNGQVIRSVVCGGHLNAPWGLDHTCHGFAIGNQGDGRLLRYQSRRDRDDKWHFQQILKRKLVRLKGVISHHQVLYVCHRDEHDLSYVTKLNP